MFQDSNQNEAFSPESPDAAIPEIPETVPDAAALKNGQEEKLAHLRKEREILAKETLAKQVSDWVDTQCINNKPISRGLFLEYLQYTPPYLTEKESSLQESDLPPAQNGLSEFFRRFIVNDELKDMVAQSKKGDVVIIARNTTNTDLYPRATLRVRMKEDGSLRIDDSIIEKEHKVEIKPENIEYYLENRERAAAKRVIVIHFEGYRENLGDIVEEERDALIKTGYTLAEDDVAIDGDTVRYTIHVKKEPPPHGYKRYEQTIVLTAKPEKAVQKKVVLESTLHPQLAAEQREKLRLGEFVTKWTMDRYQNMQPISRELFLDYLKKTAPELSLVFLKEDHSQIQREDLPPADDVVFEVFRAFITDDDLAKFTAEVAKSKNGKVIPKNLCVYKTGTNLTAYPVATLQIKINAQAVLRIGDTKISGEYEKDIEPPIPFKPFSGIQYYLEEREWVAVQDIKVLDSRGKETVFKRIIAAERAALNRNGYSFDDKHDGDTLFINGTTLRYTIHARRPSAKPGYRWHKINVTFMLEAPGKKIKKEEPPYERENDREWWEQDISIKDKK